LWIYQLPAIERLKTFLVTFIVDQCSKTKRTDGQTMW